MSAGLTVETPNGPFMLSRGCDGCTLCCKVLRADSLNKPAGTWCVHCVRGVGCGIHATRPEECRGFHCVWLMDASLGEEWQPERAHIVLSLDLEGRRLNATADPDYPDAWRSEPYYSQLKNFAAMALPRNGQVVAYLNGAVTVFLPDRHVDLGMLGEDEYIFIEHLPDGGWTARKVNEEEAATLNV